MSKSLEALKILELILNNHSIMLDANDKRNEYLFAIKQDLECLKEINKTWHQNEPLESVDFKAYQLQILYDYINAKEKEIKELKADIQEEMHNYQEMARMWHDSETKNEHLKNVIRLIKDKQVDFRLLNDCSFNLKKYNDNVADDRELTQEELEVLIDEMV